jgi:hypothetical protein
MIINYNLTFVLLIILISLTHTFFISHQSYTVHQNLVDQINTDKFFLLMDIILMLILLTYYLLKLMRHFMKLFIFMIISNMSLNVIMLHVLLMIQLMVKDMTG